MAQQSFLAKNGLRSGTLGTSAALAYAFPLAEANYDPAAGTDATRIGWYADRTGGAEKIGAVIMGTERLSVTAVGATVTGVLTATGQIVGTANGAASTSAEKLTGTWFTGGSATTTKPQLLIEPTGTTSTGWSTNGTGIGVNATTGFTGNLLDLQVNGVSVFSVPASGAIVASLAWNSLTAPTGNLSVAMANFTTAFTWNTATTGTQWAQSSTSLSSGTLASFSVASTAAAANTQTVLSVATSGANGTATQTTFGATFANTHTGATSTNIAASFSASGGTNNYAIIASNGRVGFSTSTPVASFENAFAGAASTPASLISGTWFTGGSSTTTKPQLLVEPTGTTTNNWSTNGTGIGVNAAAAFAGNLLDLQINGVRIFAVSSGGVVTGVTWDAISAPVGNLSLAMANFTTAFTWNTATTGTQWNMSSSSLSSGTLVNLAVTGTAAAANTQTVLSVATSGANAGATQTTTTASFSNTHTGTTSTNVGLTISASGGTNNYALLTPNGRVGFGTSTPVASFENASAGAASTPGTLVSGAWFTGGSSTTTKPQLLIEPTGTTSNIWNTSGTGLGVNSAAGFIGDLLNLQMNAGNRFKVAFSGAVTGFNTMDISGNTTLQALVALGNPTIVANVLVSITSTSTISNPTVNGIRQFWTVNSATTTAAYANSAAVSTAAAAFTVPEIQLFTGDAFDATAGAGSTITRYANFVSCKGSLATNHYGFLHHNNSTITAATAGNWAFLNTTTDPSSFAGEMIHAANGVASTPSTLLSGTWFTGGSSTTTKPQLLVEPTGTTTNNWSTSGTGIGVNATAGFTGNLLDLQINGVRIFAVSSGGVVSGVTWNAIAAPVGNLSLAMANFTTAFTWNTATTGTQWDMSSSSLSSGTLVDMAVTGTAAAANTQTVLNIATSGANGTATQTTTGVAITNTHTGTTSTNVGITISASGGTNNYALLVTAGRMGFSTSTPVAGFENAFNAAASTPAKLVSGTWFTGGSSTTTKPQVLIEPTGTTSTSWNTSGTGFGINAASGFTGNLFDAQLNGVSVGALTSAGVMTIGANAGTTTSIIINAAAATQRALIYKTAGSTRWNVRAGNAAESGGNVGSSYLVEAYDDSGVSIDFPIVILRPSGGTFTTTRPFIDSYTSIASVPAGTWTGSWFTGGSATTTKPQLLVEPTGTTTNNWSTSGTGIGVNAAAAFAGNLLDLQINGVRIFAVGSGGVTTGVVWSAITAPTANLTVAMANFTTTMTWNTATTGTQWTMSSSSLSSGTLEALTVTGTAAAGNTQTVQAISTSGANGTTTQTTFGTTISNTHTGTSSTNVALQLTASGGTNNYAMTITAGDVGMGTSTPTAFMENANNGALSKSGALFSGTWITGGSATTTKPYVNIETAGATSTNWGTTGTALGINSASGFTGNFLDTQLNGVRRQRMDATGNFLMSGGGVTGSTTSLQFTMSNGFESATGGSIALLQLNTGAAIGGGGDKRLGGVFFGGTTAAGVVTNSAGVSGVSEANFSSTSAPTYILYETTPSASVTRVERARMPSGGGLLIGTAGATNAGLTAITGSFPSLVLQGAQNTNFGSVNCATGANTTGATASYFKTRTTTGAATTIIVNGDVISNLASYGADGVVYRLMGQIQTISNGAPASGNMPAVMTFSVNLGGTGVTESMRISTLNNLLVGTTTDITGAAGSISHAGEAGAVTTTAGGATLTGSNFLSIHTGAGTDTFTLPLANIAGAGRGSFQVIKNRGSNALTIAAAGADTIEGSATISLAAGASVTLIANGVSEWEQC